MRSANTFALALCALSFLHCSADDRQLVVVVSSDLTVPNELAGVDVRIEDEAGAQLAAQTFVVAGPSGVGVPFSFGVAPREAGAMVLVVQARGPSLPENFPAVRRRIDGIPSGRTGLAIYLSRGCGLETCAQGQTCTDGGCAPSLVAENELVPLGADQDELSLVCSTGPMRCTTDEQRRRSCGVLGQPPIETPCPNGQRCDEGEARCVPVNETTRRVEVNLSAGAPGRVVSDPAGIRCGLGDNDCRVNFPRDSTVRLIAEPAATGQFLAWTGDCVGTGDCVLVLSEHRVVGASFGPKPPDGVEIQLEFVGNGSGEIRFSLPPDQPPCNSSCSRTFPRGTQVHIEAEAAAQTEFLGWNGACTGTESCLPDTSGSGPISISGRFERRQWNVTFNFGGGGSAQLEADGTAVCDTSSAPCVVPLAATGNEVVLEATPIGASRVVGFTGLCQGSGSTCAFVPSMDGVVNIEVRPLSRFDLNGDGQDELWVGAPGASGDTSLGPAGRLYGLSGPPGGNGLVEAGTTFFLEGESGDEAGYVYAFPGDLDGDGLADLVVGSPTADNQRGVVYVIPGHTDLGGRSGMRDLAIAELRGTAASRFGAAVLALPDQNGDGRPEFAVGVPGQRRVEIFGFDRNQSGLRLIGALDGTGLDLGFGLSLANLGDLDGDGAVEMAVAAPNATVNMTLFAGVVHIFKGPFNVANVAAGGSWHRILGATLNQGVGTAIAAGTGLVMPNSRDLAITAGLGTNNRAVAIFSNLANEAARDIPFDQHQRLVMPPVGSSVRFGASLLLAGDLLGAGGGTLLVGDPELNGAGTGVTFVFPRQGASISPRLIAGGDCNVEGCAENRFGTSLGLVPDFDGDGLMDVAVGAMWGGGSAGALGRGRAFFFASADLRANMDLPRFVVQGEDLANGRCLALGLPF